MWRPDFPYVERSAATVAGFHRAFCIASTVHRGTRNRPGLVLGLDRGQACAGMAYRVAAGDTARVIAYLRERELIYGVYRETLVPVTLAPTHPHPERLLSGASDADQHPERLLSGASDADQHPRETFALAYTVERCHPSYTGDLALAVQAQIIRGARGQSGANLDYLINTVRHLQALGIRERRLERLMALAGGFAANAGGDTLHRPRVQGLRSVWARMPSPNPPLPPGDQRRFGHRIAVSRG